jgi:CheY-like chemotaxis protein
VPAAQPGEGKTDQQSPRRGSETVLLVEDEEAVRRFARIALESQGYTVLAASSGAEAIRLIERHLGPVHLLVTDVVMPSMGGRELAELLRRQWPTLRVLYVSGYTDDAVVRHGVNDATDAFLQKPFSPLALARKVRCVLEECQSPQALRPGLEEAAFQAAGQC